MICELNHVGVYVSDLDASLDLYVSTLGGVVVDRALIPATSTDCVYVQLGTGMIELLHTADPPPSLRSVMNHLGFMADDLGGDYLRLLAAGYRFDGPPLVTGTSRGRLEFLFDPNGVRIELIQRTEDYHISPVSGIIKEFAHIAVTGRDMAASAEYYLFQLSMSPVAVTDGERCQMLYRIGLDAVEVSTSSVGDGSLAHIALEIADLDTAVARLQSAGVCMSDHSRPADHAAGPVRGGGPGR